MPQIMPCLWFDDRLEEAVGLYLSAFPGESELLDVARYPDGRWLTASFRLRDQTLMGLNGGPMFTPTEAFSLVVSCPDQAEVDRLWDLLTADGGAPSQCAWLKDKFGVSWQIVPEALPRLLKDPDRGRAGRAMAAMMTMQKIDVATLHRAADGQ